LRHVARKGINVSVQFGRWNFDGKLVDRNCLAKVGALLRPYSPDDAGAYSEESLSILCRAFHTTKESHRETQPHISASGVVLSWDGRLDNRSELMSQLGDLVSRHSTDVEMVSAAYQHWREDCFAMLIGDWALSIWNPHTHSLILAKDPIGTRHLYYSFDDRQVTWSTILDPLVLFAGKSFALCEEYIAGWLSFFPAAHLTPYIGIYSVPPSSAVIIGAGKYRVNKYWDFDPGKRIRYSADGEYEDHFRAIFSEAVRRRLRSDSPILAELSGGMDSSSIVCVADTIMAGGATETPRLDTVSYHDDSESNWDERAYFAKVEEKRHRTGVHIDVSKQKFLSFELDSDHFPANPGTACGSDEVRKQLAAHIASQGNRVLLSGIGGDEVTGGVPTPDAELEDLLARAEFEQLAHQLNSWALNKREPWFRLLFSASRHFFSPNLIGVPKHKQPARWLNIEFVRRSRAALLGYEKRTKLFGPLPSFQANVATLDALRRQLACTPFNSQPLVEKRYPFLDRSLLEFLYAIPRDQLVRPGQRRSLMRRALAGIVPDEVLNRRRKAYIARGPITFISTEWDALAQLTQAMTLGSLGIVQESAFRNALRGARQGREVGIVQLLRTFRVELWLRRLHCWNVLGGRHPDVPGRQQMLGQKAKLELSAEKS